MFLVKRIDTSLIVDGDLTNLDTKELAYTCKVEMSSGSNAVIYTNLEERLSYTAGHTTAHKEMTSGYITWVGCTPASLGDTLVSEEKQDRIYEITVKIYDNASFSGDALCTFSGTKLK